MYHLFGRHRLTITQLAQADTNTEIALGILSPCHTELIVTISLLEESYIRDQALQLLERLDGEIDGVCLDWRQMSEFWHRYGEILGRSGLEEQEIRSGKDIFEYWTEGEGWKKIAWGMREEVQKMLEICRVNIRHQLARRGHGVSS